MLVCPTRIKKKSDRNRTLFMAWLLVLVLLSIAVGALEAAHEGAAVQFRNPFGRRQGAVSRIVDTAAGRPGAAELCLVDVRADATIEALTLGFASAMLMTIAQVASCGEHTPHIMWSGFLFTAGRSAQTAAAPSDSFGWYFSQPEVAVRHSRQCWRASAYTSGKCPLSDEDKCHGAFIDDTLLPHADTRLLTRGMVALGAAVVRRHLRLQPLIARRVEAIASTFAPHMVGVHIRGTDYGPSVGLLCALLFLFVLVLTSYSMQTRSCSCVAAAVPRYA